MAAGIWVRLMRKTKIDRDVTVPGTQEEWREALEKACHDRDVPHPVLLPRHERDWAEFSQARFLRDQFMEDVPFDRMEVEFIDPDKKKRINEMYL